MKINGVKKIKQKIFKNSKGDLLNLSLKKIIFLNHLEKYILMKLIKIRKRAGLSIKEINVYFQFRMVRLYSN